MDLEDDPWTPYHESEQTIVRCDLPDGRGEGEKVRVRATVECRLRAHSPMFML